MVEEKYGGLTESEQLKILGEVNVEQRTWGFMYKIVHRFHTKNWHTDKFRKLKNSYV